MSTRDSQRQKVYDAEHSVIRPSGNLRVSRFGQRCLVDDVRATDSDGATIYYPSINNVQAYVDAVRTSAAFRRRWGHVSLTVVSTHGNTARGGFGQVHIPVNHRHNEALLLHEIAHNLVGRHKGGWHGPEFAATLLELFKIVLPGYAPILRAAYSREGVKYRTRIVEVPKPDAARLARAQRVKVTVAKVKPAAKRAEPKPLQPVTYEDAYKAGYRWPDDWDGAKGRWMTRNDRRIRITREASAATGVIMPWSYFGDAFDDGYLDAAAGRERYHLRDCKAHHNNEGGCRVA